MTNTPRTNAAVLASNGQWSYVLKLCAEDLERELAAAQEEIDMMGIRYAAAEMHHANNMQEVTEQRDEYKAALQSADNHNHEIATKLEIVTEQRDRLAEALKEYREALHDGPENCSYKMYEAVDEFAEQALQSLNPDHTVDANDMIAAVKGGADE